MNKNILVKKANKKQLIILFIIVAAIASISYSKFYSKKTEKTKDDTEKQTIDLNSKEYDMSRNKEYIEDLFSAQKVKKWKKLTLLEKRVRLEYIIKNQCVKLGMETVPPLIAISPYLYPPSTALAPPPPQPIAAPGCLPAFVAYPP